jgi:hypothetical protein
LFELSEQPEPDRVMENLVDNTLTSSIEQLETQRINVLDDPVSPLRRSLEQVHFQTEQPNEVQFSLVISLFLSSFNSLSLFQNITKTSTGVHDKSLGDLHQDTSDQP